MTSQTKYNSKTSFVLLQLYLMMMDGEEVDMDTFVEISGLSQPSYSRIMRNLADMIDDLHLSCKLQRFTDIIETKETIYKSYRYKLVSRIDYSFRLDDDLSDEAKVLYSAVITYLKLKNKKYVSNDTLGLILPNFNRKIFAVLIQRLQDIIGEDLYKNELQTYVIEEYE